MRLAAVLLLPVLAGCFHAAPDESVDRPAWRAGDAWTLLTSDRFGGVAQLEYEALGPGPKGTWMFRVKAVGAPSQTVYASPDTLRFSADPENASRPPHWPWPIAGNATWGGTDSGRNFTALARPERLDTDLGNLRTVHVTFTNATGPVQDVWYAPAAKFWARVEDHPTGTVSALIAYQVS